MGDGRALRHPMSEHARAGLGRLPHYTLGSGSTQIHSSPRWVCFTSVPGSSGRWFSSVHISLHFVQFRPVHFSTVQVWSAVQFSSLHVVHFSSLRHSSVQYRSFQVGGSVSTVHLVTFYTVQFSLLHHSSAEYCSSRYISYSSFQYCSRYISYNSVHYVTVQSSKFIPLHVVQFSSLRYSSVPCISGH